MRPSNPLRSNSCSIGNNGLVDFWRFAVLTAEKLLQFWLLRIFASHFFVVDAEFLKDAFVAVVKLVPTGAPFVIDDGAPAFRLEDTDKLRAGGFKIEPVQRLADGHKVSAMIRQGRGFSRSVECVVSSGYCERSSSHAERIAWLGSTAKTVLPFCRKSSASIPVPAPMSAMTDAEARPQCCCSRCDQIDWIVWAKLAICIDPAAESLF